MPHKRLSTWQKATALVPLALLSGAWTASLASTSTATAATEQGTRLPDGTSVPDQAIEVPASVSAPGEIAPGVPAGATDSVISGSSANGIPAAALAAYQRAAQVIDAADPGCRIDWPLIAAIGRVESDHGRYGGNILAADGTSSPGIYGIALDGSNGTARIGDTDAGQYDDDDVFDRAVGPMQFIPSTWSVVGVDGDGDGLRNPQDIDDAALATAVYLCSGEENLATTEGQRASVYRYNHSQDYVNLVLAIMRAYSQGDYAAVPNSVAGATTFAASDTGLAGQTTRTRKHRTAEHAPKSGDRTPGRTDTSGSSPNGGTSAGDTGTGSALPTGPSPVSEPAQGADDPVEKVTDPVKDAGEEVQAVLVSSAQAVSLCTAEVAAQFPKATSAAADTAVTSCAGALQGKTLAQAQASVGSVVAGLEGTITGLLGLVGGLLGP